MEQIDLKLGTNAKEVIFSIPTEVWDNPSLKSGDIILCDRYIKLQEPIKISYYDKHGDEIIVTTNEIILNQTKIVKVNVNRTNNDTDKIETYMVKCPTCGKIRDLYLTQQQIEAYRKENPSTQILWSSEHTE